MKILILGNGQLGQQLANDLEEDKIVLSHSDWDISLGFGMIKKKLSDIDVVINTMSLSAKECEKNLLDGIRINGIGAVNGLQLAEELKAKKYIYMSSDYVFGGEHSEYTENMCRNPINNYGISKMVGEKLVEISSQIDYNILRISTLFGKYSSKPENRNYIDTILKAAQENEKLTLSSYHQFCPCYAKDVALQIKSLIDGNYESGIYHATNNYSTNYYELGKFAINVMRIDCDIEEIKVPLSWDMKRPQYSVLKNTKLPVIRHSADGWKTAVKEYLKEKYEKTV